MVQGGIFMATEKSEVGLKDMVGTVYDIATDKEKREQFMETAKTAKELLNFFALEKKKQEKVDKEKASKGFLDLVKESWDRGNARAKSKGLSVFSDTNLGFVSAVVAGGTLLSGGSLTTALAAGAMVYAGGKYVAPILADAVNNFVQNMKADGVVKDFVEKNPSFKGMEKELKDLHKSLLRDSAELEGLKSLMDMNKDGKVNLEDLQKFTDKVRNSALEEPKKNVYKEPVKETVNQEISSVKRKPANEMAVQKEPVKEMTDVEKDEKTQREGLKYNRDYDISHGYPVGPEKPLQEILHPTVNKDMSVKKEEIAPKMEKFHLERPTGSLKAKTNDGNEREMGSRSK